MRARRRSGSRDRRCAAPSRRPVSTLHIDLVSLGLVPRRGPDLFPGRALDEAKARPHARQPREKAWDSADECVFTAVVA